VTTQSTSPVPSAVKAQQSQPDYDYFAEAYALANDTGLFNAWYERPELLRLAGDVRGLRVLDAGCGHGPLLTELWNRGAVVSGFDLSPAMIRLARERLGEDADLHVADLAAPLPYADDAFDLAVLSLSLHYVEDWAPTLGELRRVLRPGGRILVAIIHPFVYAVSYQDRDYFALTQYTEDYAFGDAKASMTYWHRPLQDVINSFLSAGLVITSVTEPEASQDTPIDLLPPKGRRFICFLFIALESP
jgi:SAM-dependent methyltransferase